MPSSQSQLYLWLLIIWVEMKWQIFKPTINFYYISISISLLLFFITAITTTASLLRSLTNPLGIWGLWRSILLSTLFGSWVGVCFHILLHKKTIIIMNPFHFFLFFFIINSYMYIFISLTVSKTNSYLIDCKSP